MALPPTWSRRPIAARLATVASLAVVGVACGADGAEEPELSALGSEGRAIALQNGCAACHGADGQGGVGPAFVGLIGTMRTFEDGSTEVADRDYLTRSIREPDAQLVEGYDLRMPSNNLTDDEIEAVVQWIVDLGAEPPADDAIGVDHEEDT